MNIEFYYRATKYNLHLHNLRFWPFGMLSWVLDPGVDCRSICASQIALQIQLLRLDLKSEIFKTKNLKIIRSTSVILFYFTWNEWISKNKYCLTKVTCHKVGFCFLLPAPRRLWIWLRTFLVHWWWFLRDEMHFKIINKSLNQLTKCVWHITPIL